ncbi:MAG: hypothetical protein ACREKM_05020 [Longimicrobiales bacterium]
MTTCHARTGAQRARWASRPALWLVAASVAAGCDVPTALPRFENTLALPAPAIEVPALGAPVQTPPATVDLTEVDESFAERARGGEVQFTPVNPEDGTGTLQVTITEPQSGTTVSQSITVTPEGTAQVVSVNEQEIRAFLGRDVQITLSGALGPAAVPVQTVTLETLVRLVFEIGGEG